MCKRDFLDALRAKLSRLPKQEIDGRLNFYEEMIDDLIEEGYSEEAAVAKIGNVEDVFVQIIADVSLTKIAKERLKPKRRFKAWEIILLLLGSPIWISLIVAACAVGLSFYVSFWATVLSVWCAFFAIAVCAPVGVIVAVVYAVIGDGYAGIAVFSLALVCVGVSVFLFFACKAAAKGGLRLLGEILLGIKKLFMKKGRSYEE